jgi:protein SCO1
MLKTTLIYIFLSVLSASSTANDALQKDEVLTVNNQLPGGDFVLQSSQGEFSLKQLRGKVVLLYFGYTKCPDVCPTALSILAQTLNELSEDELTSVQAVFISVDPKRDTFEALDKYVNYFHSNLVGVTGTPSEIAEVAKRYGVKYQEVPIEGSSFGYGVDHSAATYLLAPDGELRFMFPHETPPFVILEAIRYLLDGKS